MILAKSKRKKYLAVATLIILGLLLIVSFANIPTAKATTITNSPTACSGSWANPTNAYADGTNYASETTNAETENYGSYGFSLSGVTITSVRIRFDSSKVGSAVASIRIYFSTTGGVSFNANYMQQTLTTSETTYWFDITSYVSWNSTLLDNAHFCTRAYDSAVSGRQVNLDWIPVEVTYSYAPVNGLGTVAINMDDTNNLYAQKKDYTATSSVSDSDGYAGITYMEFRIKQSANTRAIFRYTEDTNTFSTQSGSTEWTLTTGSCSASRSGNNINATWAFTPQWDATEEANLEIEVYAIDSASSSDTDTAKTDYFDVIKTLVTSSIECTDGDDPDRVNVTSSIQIDVVTRYANNPSSTTASTSYPPDAEFTSISVHDASHSVLGTDSTIANGVANVTGTASSSVVSTTYHAYVNGADADYVDGDINTNTEAVITDRIKILTLGATDARIDLSATGTIYATAELEYDNHALGSGDSLTISSIVLSWDAGDSRFEGTDTSATVQQKTYNAFTSGSEATYTITAGNVNGKTASIIWDKARIYYEQLDDSRVNINDTIEYQVKALLLYDDHTLGSGDTVTANAGAMSWDAGNSWFEKTKNQSTVSDYTFQVTSLNEATYDITAFETNQSNPKGVWDRVVLYYEKTALTVGNSSLFTNSMEAYRPNATEIMSKSEILSRLPIPSGRSFVSAGSANYWDGSTLHVWYGCTTSEWDETNDDLFYTNTTDFISWSTPVMVINLTYPYGIRNPSAFVEGGAIYLFCQEYYGGNFSIRLYKILTSASKANSSSYTYIGIAVTRGASGEFDDKNTYWLSLTKIGTTYYGLYGAQTSSWNNTIGKTSTTDLESIPYTKLGMIKYANGTAIHHPDGWGVELAPTGIIDNQTVTFHYGSGEVYNIGIIRGLISGDVFDLDLTITNPRDDYTAGHASFSNVGQKDGRYLFMVQAWDDAPFVLHLYGEELRSDLNNEIQYHVKAVLEYDQTPLGDSDFISNNDFGMGWDVFNGYFSGAYSRPTVGNYTFEATSVTQSSYNITSFYYNVSVSTRPVGIWDRITVSYKAVDDGRINVGGTGEVRFRLRSEYDGLPVASPNVEVNGANATWDSSNFWWERSYSNSTVVKNDYGITSVTWQIYGLKGLNSGVTSNTTSIIWDRIMIWQQNIVNPNAPVSPTAIQRDISFQFINNSNLLSRIKLPSGRYVISAQPAVYWDGACLHVWFGSTTSQWDDYNDDIFYINTTDFVNWATPFKVIDIPNGIGIRDPTQYVEGNTIYLFCQTYNETYHRFGLRAYKILKTDSFTNTTAYQYLGIPLTLGAFGEFDEYMVASACITKIGTVYYLVYEAQMNLTETGDTAIGLANTTDLESFPYNKMGALLNNSGQILRNPFGLNINHVPCTFLNESMLFIHFNTVPSGNDWQVGYITGSFNTVYNHSLYYPFKPAGDLFDQYTCLTNIGQIEGTYKFIAQCWNDSYSGNAQIFLFSEPPRVDLDTEVIYTMKAVLAYDQHIIGLSDDIYVISNAGYMNWDTFGIYVDNGWYVPHSESTVTAYTFNITSIAEQDYNITVYSINSTYPKAIWDKLNITYFADDYDVEVGTTVNMTIVITHEYDGLVETPISIFTNRNGTYFASGMSFSDMNSVLSIYQYTCKNVTDTFGLTGFDSNTITVTWSSPSYYMYILNDLLTIDSSTLNYISMFIIKSEIINIMSNLADRVSLYAIISDALNLVSDLMGRITVPVAKSDTIGIMSSLGQNFFIEISRFDIFNIDSILLIHVTVNVSENEIINIISEILDRISIPVLKSDIVNIISNAITNIPPNFSATASDAFNLIISPLNQIAMWLSKSDTVNILSNTANQVAIPIVKSDVFVIASSALNQFGIWVSKSDLISILSSTANHISIPIVKSDIIQILSDIIASFPAPFSAVVSDALNILSSPLNQINMFILKSDFINILVDIVNHVAMPVVKSDTLNLVSGSLSQINIWVLKSDFINVLSNIIANIPPSVSAIASDTLNLLASPLNQISVFISKFDLINILTSMTGHISIPIVKSDVLNMVSSSLNQISIWVSKSDFISILDNMLSNIPPSFTVVVSDALNILSSPLDRISLLISKSDIINIISDTINHITISVAKSDIVQIVTNLITRIPFEVIKTEVINIFSSPLNQISVLVSKSDFINIVTEIASHITIPVVKSDTVRIVTEAYNMFPVVEIMSETIRIFSNVANRMTVEVSRFDIVSFFDSVSHQLGYFFTRSDSIRIGEDGAWYIIRLPSIITSTGSGGENTLTPMFPFYIYAPLLPDIGWLLVAGSILFGAPLIAITVILQSREQDKKRKTLEDKIKSVTPAQVYELLNAVNEKEWYDLLLQNNISLTEEIRRTLNGEE